MHCCFYIGTTLKENNLKVYVKPLKKFIPYSALIFAILLPNAVHMNPSSKVHRFRGSWRPPYLHG